MRKIIQTLFFFSLLTQICFAQWYQQNSGTTKNLNAVSFLDANNGFAVGDNGTILYTDNGGATWIQQNSGTTLSLNDICLVNANNIWVVGGTEYGNDSPVILYSSDSGISWTIQLGVPSLDSMWLKSVYFTDINTGWIVGTRMNNDWAFETVILKTINGGTNWISQSSPVTSTTMRMDDIYFNDANVGFMLMGVGNIGGFWGHFYNTTDGGDNWIDQFGLTGTWYHSISFSDKLNGILVGEGYGMFGNGGRVFHTTDGGINWIEMTGVGYSLISVAYPDLNQVWAIGLVSWSGEGTIFYSSDSGITWSTQGVFSDSLNGVYFINSSTGWVVGDSGIILHTTNGGVAFVEEDQIDGFPTEYNLTQNYPNPFNPSTKIKYSIPQTSQVQVKVFDVLGNEIETLVNEEKSVGSYELTWNAEQLPSGIYFYLIQAGSFIDTKKMILIK
jgi:photosystem II stability/assembly factor-like uncharacterized protein